MPGNGKTMFFILGNYWKQCQGGAELQAHFLEREAYGQGYRTHYLFLSNNEFYNKDIGTILHPIIRKRIWNKLGNIKYPYAGKLLKTLNKIKPDIIYQRGGMAFTGIAAYYAKKNNCRFIFHIAKEEDVQPPTIPWYRFYVILEIKFMQYGIRHADIIIAQCQMQAKLLFKNYGKKAIVIPSAHPVPEDCRKDKNKILILWIGNWKPVKQPEIFVRLAGEIECTKKITLMMLGRTDNYDQLVLKAPKNNIEVTGEIPIDQVNKLLEKAHLLINTSKNEGFSNTFIQAWMRKVPVISLNVDPDNILQTMGIGCCSGNFSTLVQDTKRLIADNIARDDMGKKAREYAIKNHSMDNMDKIIKCMES